MRDFFHLTLPATLVACWLSGCSPASDPEVPGGEAAESGVVTIHVVNYPLQYFAERIGGEHAQVFFPAPRDGDPAFWTPDAATIVQYQQADLILLNGASYARWTRTVSLPESRLVDTSTSFTGQYIKVKDAVTHSHGPGGEHSHAGTAFTTWLDPKLALAQAEAIRQALIKLRPEHADTFRENFARLEGDLNELDARIVESVTGATDRPLVFSHPVYQYLTRRYNLNARSVHWEPDAVPSTQMWTELAAMLEQHPAKWMIWEGEPVEESTKKLRELGVRSTVFDPCGNVPEEGDFLQVMQRNVENLKRVFGG